VRELAGKKVLVTGGAGFIGSHLVDALAGADVASLVVVDNLFLGKPGNLKSAAAAYPGLVVKRQDACDLETMKRLVREFGVEVVFNLAVVPLPASLEDPAFCVQQNVDSALAVCELARHGDIETLIHFSSSEVYGTAQKAPMDEEHPTNPLTPYAASKLAGDHLVLSYVATFAIDAAIVRPFNNFGPRQNERQFAGVIPLVIRRTLAGDTVEISGDGLQTRDYVYVEDTVRGALDCYRQPGLAGKVINLGSGREQPIGELVRQVVRLAGGDPADVVHGPERPADVRRHCADISLARRLIGFEPATGLEPGLALTVDWYLSQSRPG